MPGRRRSSSDLLTDLGEVTRADAEPVRLADLARQLQRLAPAWTAYRQLTGVQLRAQLEAEGVRVTNTGNVPRLDPADLRAILGRRDEE